MTTNIEIAAELDGTRSHPFRKLAVMALSLGVFLFSAGSMYGTWLFLASFHILVLVRGMISLFTWVGSFALGTAIFWKLVKVLGSPD